MTSMRKFLWRVFSWLVFLYSFCLPLYLLFSQIRQGGEITPYITFVLWLTLPMAAIFGLSMWLPMLINNKAFQKWAVICIGPLIFALANVILPVKYFFPSILLLIATYLVFLLLCLTVILPVGRKIKEILLEGWILYKSPKSIKDLAKTAPQNIISVLEISWRQIFASIFLLTMFIGMVKISNFHPAVWGIGMPEFKQSFPNDESFRNTVLNKFFIAPSDLNIQIQRYNRNPIISLCKMSLPINESNSFFAKYKATDELIVEDKDTQKEFYITFLKSTLPATIFLEKHQKNNITILQLTESFFLTHYPGLLSECPEIMSTGVENCPYLKNKQFPEFIAGNLEQDLQQRWFLKKDNILLCPAAGKTIQEDKFINILNSLRYPIVKM